MNLQRYQLTTINMPSSTTATIPVFLSSLPLHFISSTTITTCSSSHSNDPTSHWEPNSSLQPTTRDNNKDNTVTLFHTHSHFLSTVPFFQHKCFTSIITLPQVKQINRRSNQTALQLEAPNIHTISIITHDSHHSTHSRSKYLPFPIPTFSASLCTFSLSQPPTLFLIQTFRHFNSPLLLPRFKSGHSPSISPQQQQQHLVSLGTSIHHLVIIYILAKHHHSPFTILHQ